MDRSVSSFVVVALLVLVVGFVAPSHFPPNPLRDGSTPPVSSVAGATGLRLPSAGASALPLDLLGAHPGVVLPAITSAMTIIYPNGTISNLSAPINVSGNVYSITANFTGGLEIERSHTFLHGNDWTITTALNLSAGVIVANAIGVTVRSLSVQGGPEGFLVLGSSYVHLASDRTNNSSGWAIDLESSTNVSVSGSSVMGGEGLYAYRDGGLNLSNNTITNATFFGVFAEFDSSALVFANNVSSTFGNILLANSVGVTVLANHAEGGEYGLYLYGVTNALYRGNFVNGSIEGYFADSTTGLQASSDRVTNDTIAVSIYYGFNLSFSHERLAGASLDAFDLEYSTSVTVGGSTLTGAGFRGALVLDSTNVTFDGDNLSGFGAYGLQANNTELLTLHHVNASDPVQSYTYGFYLASDLQATITASWANASEFGLYATGTSGLSVTNSAFSRSTGGAFAALLESSQSINFQGNDLSNASGDGLYADSCSNVSVLRNDLSYAVIDALVLASCTQVNVVGNNLTNSGSASAALFSCIGVTVSNNNGGKSTQTFGDGFIVASGADILLDGNSAPTTNISYDLSGTADLQVLDNNGSRSYIGLYFQGLTDASIVGNTFFHDQYGFEAGGDFGVAVYHNNFVNDAGWMNPASADAIAWDHGYPGGGNFWGNWSGPDLFSGPSQNLSGADGIVDVPLTINSSNVDHYPLARPWTQATVGFSESGLAPHTVWSVRVAGTLVTGNTSILVYGIVNASNESLPYQIGAVSGYHPATPSSGFFAYQGSDATLFVTFAPFTYPVTFRESGLATGTAWSVNIDSTSLLSVSPDANISVANGTYGFSAPNVTGYALTTPGGTVTIDSAGAMVPIQFVEIVHPTVYNNQTLYHNQTIYHNNTGGSNGSGGGGNGGGGTPASKGSTTTTGYSAMLVYALIAALAALAVLAALGFALYGRARNRSPPAAAQAWSPPASPPAAAAPPAAAVGPGAVAAAARPSAGAPGGAPDWREDP